MQVLNEKEVASIEVKIIGASKRESKNRVVFDAISQLKEGQSLIVKKDEWVGKTPPGGLLCNRTVRAQLKGRRYHCFTLKDESGWLIAPKKQS